MQIRVQVDGPALDRAGCSSLVERLQGETAPPAHNDVLRVVRYSYISKPEGIRDWVRADVFEYLKGRSPQFEEGLRSKALGLVVGGMVDDITTAKKRLDLSAPDTIGEAVQLAFFSGDSAALRVIHSLVAMPAAFPNTFYRAFGNDLAVVLREAGKIPRSEKFLAALRQAGKDSHEIAFVELDGVTASDDDDYFIPTGGRAAQHGSPVTAYGFKPEMTPLQAWRHASANSAFQRKVVHERFFEIAKACGAAPEPEARMEWYADLKFPFIHTRVITPTPNTPPAPGRDAEPPGSS